MNTLLCKGSVKQSNQRFLYGCYVIEQLDIREIMSNNKIMQFSYLRKLNRPARKRRYFTLESAITARLRDVPRKLHHGILFALPLVKHVMRKVFSC